MRLVQEYGDLAERRPRGRGGGPHGPMTGAERPAVRVFDAHRLVGPVPSEEPSTADLDGLAAELDHLDIDACAVTGTAELFCDPGDSPARQAAAGRPAPSPGGARFLPVPVIVPAVAGAGRPATVDDVLTAAPALVRACPVRHRFDLLGPVASRWWPRLAAHGIPVALDAAECGLPMVAELAAAQPELKLLVLSPGYRELRRLAELLETFSGVHVETGTLVAAGAVEWLADRYGPHRLLFGTGAPRWDDAGARFLLDHLDLPAPDVAMIAAGSARVLIGARWPW